MSSTHSHAPQSCTAATQVLAAARALFAEHGVDAASMQDIATRAGVSKANIFHHFASKEALYLAVMRDALVDDSAVFARHTQSRAPFARRLTELLAEHLEGLLRDPEGMQLIMREMTGGNVERARLLATRLFADKVRQKIAFFDNAKARGELAASVDPVHASMLLGACASFYFNCRESSKHLHATTGMPGLGTPHEFAARMVPLLLQGIASPARARGKAGAKRASARPAAKSKGLKPASTVVAPAVPRRTAR